MRGPAMTTKRIVLRRSEFRDLLREPIEACQPLVLFLGRTAIRDSFGGVRLGVWLGRKDRIEAIEAALGAVFDFEAGLQFLRGRLHLGFRGLLARLHLDQRLAAKGRWPASGRRAALSD